MNEPRRTLPPADPAPAPPDDAGNTSVAGEEDPGAALDTCGVPATGWGAGAPSAVKSAF
jgi:hypothetical protein